MRATTSALVGVAIGVTLAAVASGDDVTARNPLNAPYFSIDPASEEVTGGLFIPSDLLITHDPNGPIISVPGAFIGAPDPNDNMNAFSLDSPDIQAGETFVLIFSVDREAVGSVPPDPNLVAMGYPFNLRDQASKNQAAGDLFMTLSLFTRNGPFTGGGSLPLRTLTANNILVINQGDAGGVDTQLAPSSMSPSQTNPGAQSNANAGGGTAPQSPARWVGPPMPDPPPEMLFYSLSANSPSLLTLPGTGSPADIFMDNDPNDIFGQTLFLAPAMIGLQQADDIDAMMVLYDGFNVQVIFSLAPGSPSLGFFGLGPGDLLTSNGAGVFSIYALAGELGLAQTDNLNLLDYVRTDDITVAIHDWAIGYVNDCVGDLDLDGDVDLSDLAILLSSYGLCDGDAGFLPEADLIPDGCIDLADLATLLSNYGNLCTGNSVTQSSWSGETSDGGSIPAIPLPIP